MRLTHRIQRIGFAMLLGVFMMSGAGATDFFPDPVFFSLKESNQVGKNPGQIIWPGGKKMLYTAITPDGQRLLVSSPAENSIYAFDTTSGKPLHIVKVGKASKGLKVSPDGKLAYVSNEGEASVSVIDLTRYEVIATIATEALPHNVRFTGDGKIAYVTLQGGAGLGVIDTRQHKVIKVIPTPGLQGPHNLDLSKDESLAFVRDLANHVGVIDLKTEQVKQIITVGNGHAGIDVSPDGRYVYTGAIADDIVTVIDAKTLKIVKTIKVGFGPHGVRASQDSRWLYVVVTADDKFVVIDTKTFEIVKNDKVASFPFWIAVNGNP